MHRVLCLSPRHTHILSTAEVPSCGSMGCSMYRWRELVALWGHFRLGLGGVGEWGDVLCMYRIAHDDAVRECTASRAVVECVSLRVPVHARWMRETRGETSETTLKVSVSNARIGDSECAFTVFVFLRFV
jgi:hypothetical protein